MFDAFTLLLYLALSSLSLSLDLALSLLLSRSQLDLLNKNLTFFPVISPCKHASNNYSCRRDAAVAAAGSAAVAGSASAAVDCDASLHLPFCCCISSLTALFALVVALRVCGLIAAA